MARDKKGAVARGATVLFVDESGFYLLPAVVRSFAPRGATPVLRHRLTRDHRSVISAVSSEGALYFNVHDKPIDSAVAIRFLRHLLRHVDGPIVVLWDGAPIHRSRAVKAFLATLPRGRLRLERLPAYAPELNPDEGIWRYLKLAELANVCANDLAELRVELCKAIKRTRAKPRIARGCFTGARL